MGGILAAVDEAGVSDRTAVFFTSDHGQQRKFGNPNLDRGKGSAGDGGTRVGLLAYLPGATDPARGGDPLIHADSQATDEAKVQLVSLVDLFPTIAHLAGYGDLPGDSFFDDDGRLLPMHAKKPNGGECSVVDPSDCPEVVLDGRSMLPMIVDPVGTNHRHFAYVHEDDDSTSKTAVVARPGYFDDEEEELCPTTGAVLTRTECLDAYVPRLCGADSVVEERHCAEGSTLTPADGTCTVNTDCGTVPGDVCEDEVYTLRRVRGGSAQECDTDSQCESEFCSAMGGLCMTNSDADDCNDATSPTPQADPITDPPTEGGDGCYGNRYARCVDSSDCTGSNVKCQDNVKIVCNKCMNTNWRLDAGQGEKAIMVDLSTNPQEAEGGEDVPLNMAVERGAGALPGLFRWELRQPRPSRDRPVL